MKSKYLIRYTTHVADYRTSSTEKKISILEMNYAELSSKTITEKLKALWPNCSIWSIDDVALLATEVPPKKP
jgi:hypothetical protein